MKFAMTKVAAATTIALAFSNVNAAMLNADTVIVNILKDGQTGQSMLIDTNVLTTDFRTGAVTSWSANTDLVAAIDAFIGVSTQVEFYVAGIETAGFSKFGLSDQVFALGESVVDSFVGTNYQSFINNANNTVTGQFFNNATVGLSESWVAGIPDGDNSHYGEALIFGSGYVVGTDMGTAATFYSNESALLGPGGSTALLDWNLSADGSLTYGVSAVPVPAAAWLFGSGLIGLVGVARRRKA